ncbi:MAG: TIGR03905 family TSCPD domain-containing protein [Lachnospiraceae bacterium]|jgi:uncharacterized protein (TIGR03905 family)|nr:TIGR03905 family TSCPD domain-containing protein [Lachnospiraceae bacterium]
MKYKYKTRNTCASTIELELEGDIVRNIRFNGGCDGNLKAIPLLVDGWSVDAIEEKCKGITCGPRSTSCADQLACAVRKAYEESQKNQ